MPASGSARPDPPRRRETLLFRAARVAVRGLCRLLFRLRVEGRERMPRDGPLVVVCNHRSILDPLFVAVAMPRRTLFVAAAEYTRMPVLGAIMRGYGVIPVRRGEVDRSVIPTVVAALRDGAVVAIFPEGGITRVPGLRPFLPGAAAVAAEARAPIVPVALLGTDRAIPPGTYVPRPRPVTVRIGSPLPPPDRDERADLDAAMAEAHDAVRALLDPSGGPAYT